MRKRYYVPVSYTGVLPNPGYMLAYAQSPDEAIQIIELIGYLVTGSPIEFPQPSESGF